MSIDDILAVVFAIALIGHGIAHAVATAYLFGQAGGQVKDEADPVRTWLLPNRSERAAAALAIVLWLPATVGFLVAAPAMLDLFFGDLPWSAILVGAALLSAAGLALFRGVWPGGERRLRPLHVFLALGMDAAILVTQLILGGPTG